MTPLFDAHLDLAWNAVQWNRDLTRPLDELRRAEARMTDHPARGRATVSLPELRRARVDVCLATVLVRSKPDVCPTAGFNRRDLDVRDQSIAYAVGQGQLAYYRELERRGAIRFLRTSEDLQEHRNAVRPDDAAATLGVILAMESADPIVSPEQAKDWWDQGLRCVGLAHYGQGPYAMGTGGEGSVTPAGRELLHEFQRLGIIIDLTHTAEPGFFEVLDEFDGPVHASHNMCRSLVPGDRQFSDDQLRRLIERDAVIGMALDAWMLHPGWKIGVTSPEAVSLEAVADHVDHICQLAGNALHVGIGSDLDGGFGTEQTPRDLDSIADLHKLEAILNRRGYSGDDVIGIFHGNWLRFFTASLPKRRQA
jgi:membrane dipeptidase